MYHIVTKDAPICILYGMLWLDMSLKRISYRAKPEWRSRAIHIKLLLWMKRTAVADTLVILI